MLWLFACTPDVRGLYESEREAALTVATERPRDWDADLRVQIAEPDLEAAVTAAVRDAVADAKPLQLSLGVTTASVRPRLSVRHAKLGASDACASCLSFDTKLDGHATWEVAGARGDFPFEVAAEGVLAVEVADGHRVRVRPQRIGAVRVKLGDLEGLRVNPSNLLQDWIRDELKEDLPPIHLVDLDPAALPVRDLRLRTGDGAVRVEALTDVPGARPASAASKLERGVRVSVSETALTGLARRAAYEQGTLEMEVAADPRALRVEGDRFTLSLRLWRLVGRGWWRDYEVTGGLAVVNGRLKLTPEDVREVDRSPGAGLVDPLAALFQNRIVEAIADVLHRSLPASRAEKVGGVRLRAEAQRVEGRDGTLHLEGSLAPVAPDKP
ncbi:MAG: hypothetical protein ACOZNI_34635 [Myxococcota bacterium]